MWTTTHAAAAADNRTPKIEPLTCAIGAEVKNVNLGVAARDPGLMAEIRALLLQYKVLFFRAGIHPRRACRLRPAFRGPRRPSGGRQRS